MSRAQAGRKHTKKMIRTESLRERQERLNSQYGSMRIYRLSEAALKTLKTRLQNK